VLTVLLPASQIKYSGAEIEALTSAWAVTVHKAQGGEFPVVALVLDSSNGPLLNRNLVYTALSRASKLLLVLSHTDPIRAYIRS